MMESSQHSFSREFQQVWQKHVHKISMHIYCMHQYALYSAWSILYLSTKMLRCCCCFVYIFTLSRTFAHVLVLVVVTSEKCAIWRALRLRCNAIYTTWLGKRGALIAPLLLCTIACINKSKTCSAHTKWR